MTQEVRQAAVRDATAIISAIIQDGGYKDLSEKEIALEVVYLADAIIAPYIRDGVIMDVPSRREEGAPF